MRVKMLVDLDITYHGQPYRCKRGRRIDLPAPKAEELIATGMAEAVGTKVVNKPPARKATK